jgi:hypothetical protein
MLNSLIIAIMYISGALGPTYRCCMCTVFLYGPNYPYGQKDKASWAHRLNPARRGHRRVAARLQASVGIGRRRHISRRAAARLQAGVGTGGRWRLSRPARQAQAAWLSQAGAGSAAAAGGASWWPSRHCNAGAGDEALVLQEGNSRDSCYV